MYSDKIVSQNFAVRILRSHIEKDRLAHTYLFTGERQSGKEEVALAFAAALNCEKKRYFGECECASCHKVLAGNHPDVRWLGKDPKVKSIKIEEVRDVLEAASLKTYEGKYKVFIVQDAGKLTIDASNAFLKTLEEPPEQTLFILTADSRANLLETIISRSFEITFKPLGEAQSSGPLLLGLSETVKKRNWEDLFDEYQSVPREEIKGFFDALIFYFHGQMQKAGSPSFLRAVEAVIETKDAVDANANQKIALSRLAMQLRRIDLN